MTLSTREAVIRGTDGLQGIESADTLWALLHTFSSYRGFTKLHPQALRINLNSYLMNWTQITQIIGTIAASVALLTALTAVFTYRRSVRTRRAEWLVSLHEKFFETERYATIRRVLDYREEPLYTELSSAIANGKSHPLAEELYRYLNFFELLAELQHLKQISKREIAALFDYDLRALPDHQFIVDVLAPQGFERLDDLLRAQLLPRRR